MKKRLLAMLMAAVFAVSLTACGSSGGSSDTEGNAAETEDASAGETADSGDKKVLRVAMECSYAPYNWTQPDDSNGAVPISGSSDYAYGYDVMMAQHIADELGYELDDDIIEATTSICYVDGDVYLAPYYGNVTVMMYNKELIAEAGYAPEDIDSFADLMDIAQKTKDAHPDKNGFLVRGGSADNILSDFLPHLVIHGGWVVDENNNPTVDTPEFKAAMEEYLALYKLGSSLDKDDIVASVTGGNTALAQIWPGWYTPTADGPADYTTIPTKLTDDSAEMDAVALQGVWCIGIPDNAPHKDLALELLEYIMSPEVQLASIEHNGVPCRYSCLTDPTVLETYPHLETVCGALETGIYRPVIEEWTQFTNILGTEMDAIIQGTKTMDEALSYAQEQLEQLMAG